MEASAPEVGWLISHGDTVLSLAVCILMIHFLFQNPLGNLTNATVANLTAGPIGGFFGNFSGNFTVLVGNLTVTNSTNLTVQLRAIPSILSVLLGSPAILFNALIRYSYTALFVLMTLDTAALPPPSELIMPPAGFLARQGYFNFGLAFLVLMLANALGASIDYWIGYAFGERVLLKRLYIFNIKQRDLKAFNSWFQREGTLAIFVARLLPVVRALINFPAGFAKMPYKRFLLFTLMGASVYNYLLMLFGYLLLSESASLVIIIVISAILVVAYLLQKFVIMGIEKRWQRRTQPRRNRPGEHKALE